MAYNESDTESKTSTEPPAPPRKVNKDIPPQQSIDDFWKNFTTKNPGKPFTILPENLYAKRAAIRASRETAPAKNAVASYEQAAAACRAKVEKIVKDCRRLNQKYKDPHFDIEFDFLKWGWGDHVEDCLATLDAEQADLRPMSVKRVEDIFEDPHFYIEGMTANDVRQGRDGDCWFMSSICTLSNKEDLLEKVCVDRDEKVGVYGFVFHRDGEWISEVIDDKLYLAKEDFHESLWDRYNWLQIDMPNPDDEYRKVMQTGSKALYFAQCRDQNETWLPLLEKAYAKAHGDYAAIEGGWVGEGLEDLTGGVTSELFAADILDKDKFWTDGLMNVNKTFLFGLAQMGGKHGERRGIIEKHAYSVMEAKEIENFRLLKIRNPWGMKEWEGAWSDGSEEWTPERMRRLNHKFGNDGVFWISYPDLLKHFQHIDRTRLFGPEWSITQQWTSVNVPWSVNYLDTHFKISLSKASSVVIVLSQLDDRYFQGLRGQYYFQLQFRLHKDGESDYITRSNPSYFMDRSVSTEIDLEAGEYCVIIKIAATRNKNLPIPEEIIRKTCQNRRDKLMAVGLSYDLAHAKGNFKESALERKERLRKERRAKRKAQAKKTFEAGRQIEKKEKLRRKRLEAKEQAKKGKTPESDENPDDNVEITIRIGENVMNLTKPHGKEEIVDGKSVVEHEGISKKLKLTLEASDRNDGTKRDEEAATEAQKQPEKESDKEAAITGEKPAEAKAEDEDKKVANENVDTKDESKIDQGGSENADAKDASAAVDEQGNEQESSTSAAGVTPDSTAASEDSKKAEVQPSDKQDSTAAEAKRTAEPEATAETGAEVDEPDTNKLDIPSLTLDDISDDGLSWASDIDAPSDTSSESESDDPAAPPSNPPPPAPNTEDDDFASDPWNAICVVGLRVYSRGSQAQIEIVRTQEGGDVVESKKLDVDDQAADATKRLQKRNTREEERLVDVGSAPEGEEVSKQG